MKVDRRGFIKFIVGGAVGVHLTPLPWKTIDDIAIWTQNWPWVPKLTRYPDYAFRPTVCTLCPGGCGIKVRLVNHDRTIKADGLPGAPANQGGVCPLGAAGPQYQYSLARFRTPLKRVGARGSGAYTKITWDEAFNILAMKMAELRKSGDAHTVALISGRGRDLVAKMSERFLTAYGSPNYLTMPDRGGNQDTAETAVFGQAKNLGYDFENSKFVLSFGAGLIEGWGSPVNTIRCYSAWRSDRPAKLIQIDAYPTLTASKADQWHAVLPGSEGALALGIAQVMVEKGLYDKKFVKANTYGFDQFASVLKKDYTPDKVAELTGLSAQTIKDLAVAFGQAEKAVAVPGKGKGDIPTSTYEVMAVMALNALKGAINAPGGVIVRQDPPLADWPEVVQDEAAQEGLAAPRLDLAQTDRRPLTKSLLDNFTASINEGRLYPVNLLLIDQANPAFFGAEPGAFRDAMGKVPFIATFSSWGDDTSIMADLVLPQAPNFEGPVDVINPPSLPYPMFGYGSAPLYKSPYLTMPAGDIYLGLAKALGGAIGESFPFESYDDAVEQAVAGLVESGRGKVANLDGERIGPVFPGDGKTDSFADAGELMDALSENLFWYDPAFNYGDLEGAFNTPSGKFEFVSQTLKEAYRDLIEEKGLQAAASEMGVKGPADQAFLPHFDPYIPVDESGFYPYLLAPVEQFKLVATALGNAPYLTKMLDDVTLEETDLVVHVHPETAHERHLKNMDRAKIKTAKGDITVRVHLFEGARPGVIFAPVGLGHTGFGYYLRGKGANPMEIVTAAADPLSGQALWWGTPANLTKA